MDLLALIGTAIGLGVSAGLSLYGTAFLLGLIIQLQWIRLAPEFEPLGVLADPVVLTVAGILFAIEFLADKIPWVDSTWDALHTVIRPIGGALLAMRVLGELSPAGEVVAFLLLGGVTLATHSAKASMRLVVNASPEPVSNVLVSLAENSIVAAGVWLALAHPFVALVLGVAALAAAVCLTVWLAGRALQAFRAFRARAAARFPAGRGSLS
jgi:Domain of unknown function (DUF4126)